MEAVVFVGGVSLGQPATSIPLATIVGLICGLIVGFILYQFASRSGLYLFLFAVNFSKRTLSSHNLPGGHDEPPPPHGCRPLLSRSRRL